MTPIPGTRAAEAYARVMEQRALMPRWWEAPLPHRWHRCRPVTTGSTAGLARVERCACGAIRLDSGPWLERNSRGRHR